MSQKDYSLPKIVKFQLAKIVKNRHKISEIANFLGIGLIVLNLDYIKDYTQRAKSTLKPVSHKRVVSQPSDIICLKSTKSAVNSISPPMKGYPFGQPLSKNLHRNLPARHCQTEYSSCLRGKLYQTEGGRSGHRHRQ